VFKYSCLEFKKETKRAGGRSESFFFLLSSKEGIKRRAGGRFLNNKQTNGGRAVQQTPFLPLPSNLCHQTCLYQTLLVGPFTSVPFLDIQAGGRLCFLMFQEEALAGGLFSVLESKGKVFGGRAVCFLWLMRELSGGRALII
jgi:hypothetical protein